MRVVALVSGGVDSVVLLDVLVRGGQEVTVLHVDHGLRPEAADDARFVRGLHPDVRVVALTDPPSGGAGIQAWARAARYREAWRLADELGGCDVATGHTASDQVEGVLYRLAASPGRRALLGMRARQGRLVRPLLDWTRADVLAYATSRGLRWREDPTNASDAYARNRARARLVPAMRALHPAAERNVLRTLELLRDEAAVLELAVADALARCDHDGTTVSARALEAEAPALRRLVLQALAGPAGPPVGGRADELLALRGRGTAGIDLGGGLRGTVVYDRLGVAAVDDLRMAPRDVGTTALRVPGQTPFFAGAVRVVRREGAVRPPFCPDVLDVGNAPLSVRTRRPGDRMTPLGMGGRHKSLQDLFVDRKVPVHARADWPVVCAGEEIVWVPGVATSEAARVTSRTTTSLHLSWHRVRSVPA